MFVARIDVELLDHRIAQGSLRKHALNGDFERAARMLRLHFHKGRFVHAAGVTGVAVVGLSAEMTILSALITTM